MIKLKVGDVAPDFKALNQSGEKVNLSSFIGSKLILFFYPKANTPGCTAEACNLRDHYSDLLNKGFKIVGVSADPGKKQTQFKEKHDLPFTLIADVDKKVIMDYGVWGLKKFMGREYDGIHRTTFIISEDGRIEKIFSKVKTKEHTQQILKEYDL